MNDNSLGLLAMSIIGLLGAIIGVFFKGRMNDKNLSELKKKDVDNEMSKIETEVKSSKLADSVAFLNRRFRGK